MVHVCIPATTIYNKQEYSNGKPVSCILERKSAYSCQSLVLAGLYDALPSYASSAFWTALEDPTLPLEVLVRTLRGDAQANDHNSAQRIMALLITRTQAVNQHWAGHVLHLLPLGQEERAELIHDLCADVHESMLRALAQSDRHFWEENFMLALYFERKHVLRTFMRREGLWTRATCWGKLAPRLLLTSLDTRQTDEEGHQFEIEDTKAHAMLMEAEDTALCQLVLGLPEKLKPVVWLIFWDGYTEKETASLLGITERTVRNRLRAAYQELRTLLQKIANEEWYA